MEEEIVAGFEDCEGLELEESFCSVSIEWNDFRPQSGVVPEFSVASCFAENVGDILMRGETQRIGQATVIL
ncbi:unnamed protein product [Linum trigynum]|uniref:Uncharacterized protein n=1 Tax=Linum trigynum TaxID=586398 RepID=A0AAV2GGF7_9ROSI